MCIFLDSLILDSDMICVIYISIYIMGSIPRGLDFLKSPSCGKSTRGPVRCLTRFWMHPSPSTVISFLWLPVCLLLRCKWGRLFTSIEKVFVSCRNTLSFKIIYLHEHFGARVKSSPRLLSLFAGATCEHVKRSCLWSGTFVDFMVTILKSMVSRRFTSAVHLSAEIMQQRSYEVRKTCTYCCCWACKARNCCTTG